MDDLSSVPGFYIPSILAALSVSHSRQFFRICGPSMVPLWRQQDQRRSLHPLYVSPHDHFDYCTIKRISGPSLILELDDYQTAGETLALGPRSTERGCPSNRTRYR